MPQGTNPKKEERTLVVDATPTLKRMISSARQGD